MAKVMNMPRVIAHMKFADGRTEIYVQGIITFDFILYSLRN